MRRDKARALAPARHGPRARELVRSYTGRPPGIGRPEPGPARRATLGLLIGLLVQFTLGMLVNLFVTIPESHPGAQPAEYFSGSVQSVAWALVGSGQPLLALHAVLGLLLVIGAVGLVVRARSARSRAVTLATVVGALAVLAAGFNGASFLDFGLDASSMIMAALFALAMLCYIIVLFILPAD